MLPIRHNWYNYMIFFGTKILTLINIELQIRRYELQTLRNGASAKIGSTLYAIIAEDARCS